MDQQEQPQQEQDEGEQQLPNNDLDEGAQQQQQQPAAAEEMDLDASEDDDDEEMNDGDYEDDDDSDGDSTSDDDIYVNAGRDWGTIYMYVCKQLLRDSRHIHAPYSFRPLKLIRQSYKDQSGPVIYPLARSGHRIIASESNLYSLGGYNPRSALTAAQQGQCMLFQELWCYNFATNRWKLMLDAKSAGDSMPQELASNALVIHNNALISHGGTGFPFGVTCSNDCYVYTTGEKPIVKRLETTGDLPTAQYGPGIVIHEDYLYTIGGTTGFDYYCDVYRLNLKTKVWENVYICRPEMRDDPEGRYRHEVVYDGTYIYVLGGGTSNIVYDLQRIPAFNLKETRWEHFDTLPDKTMRHTTGYPMPRKCFSCVQHTTTNGDVEAFITGGMQADLTTYFMDTWKLNLSSKQWTSIRSATLPKPLYFHSATHANNGCMYIFGGIEYNEKDMRRRNYLYKMWMTIPKLTDICWDAITYYNRQLHKFDRNKLLAAGIPDYYVQRLPLKR